jgi:hypothetical protein
MEFIMKFLGFGSSDKNMAQAATTTPTIPVISAATNREAIVQAFDKQQALWRILNDLLAQESGVSEEMIKVAEKNAYAATRELQTLVHLPTDDLGSDSD